MTRAALKRLRATGKRFCLLVEGSRIDHGLHVSDPVAAGFDSLAYDEAVKHVLDEVSANKVR